MGMPFPSASLPARLTGPISTSVIVTLRVTDTPCGKCLDEVSPGSGCSQDARLTTMWGYICFDCCLLWFDSSSSSGLSTVADEEPCRDVHNRLNIRFVESRNFKAGATFDEWIPYFLSWATLCQLETEVDGVEHHDEADGDPAAKEEGSVHAPIRDKDSQDLEQDGQFDGAHGDDIEDGDDVLKLWTDHQDRADPRQDEALGAHVLGFDEVG
nr:hypothetical protein CFP56_09537 [Quercus suber]